MVGLLFFDEFLEVFHFLAHDDGCSEFYEALGGYESESEIEVEGGDASITAHWFEPVASFDVDDGVVGGFAGPGEGVVLVIVGVNEDVMEFSQVEVVFELYSSCSSVGVSVEDFGSGDPGGPFWVFFEVGQELVAFFDGRVDADGVVGVVAAELVTDGDERQSHLGGVDELDAGAVVWSGASVGEFLAVSDDAFGFETEVDAADDDAQVHGGGRLDEFVDGDADAEGGYVGAFAGVAVAFAGQEIIIVNGHPRMVSFLFHFVTALKIISLVNIGSPVWRRSQAFELTGGWWLCSSYLGHSRALILEGSIFIPFSV